MKRALVLALLLACSSDDSRAGSSPPTNDGGAETGTGNDAGAFDANGCCGEVAPPRRVFVTRALRTGANGDVAGADAACAEEAKAANLTGQFVAWISSPKVNAVDRLRTDAAFMAMDAKILWQSRAEIEAGKGPAAGITLDAAGTAVTGFTHVWTGTNATGKATAEHCLEWTTNVVGAKGTAGVFGATGKDWTEGTSKDCGDTALLLCFEK